MSDTTSNAKIAFIGAGNMATSIIGGLISRGHAPEAIAAADPYQPSLDKLQQTIADIHTETDNGAVIADADIVVLAVKPQVMADVTANIRESIAATKPVVISIAAGITIGSLEKWLGEDTAIVRCMPNTPALIQAGATGLYANNKVSSEQQNQAEAILSATGLTRWVASESLLDAVTALSGSGPAYFFMFMQAMADTGEKMGLDRETSELLAMQTGVGAAQMALQSDVDLQELTRRVCSPGGTTERAVQSFQQEGMDKMVENAMQAALNRAVEMAKEMG